MLSSQGCFVSILLQLNIQLMFKKWFDFTLKVRVGYKEVDNIIISFKLKKRSIVYITTHYH